MTGSGRCRWIWSLAVLWSCGTGTLACARVSFLRKQAPAGVPVPQAFVFAAAIPISLLATFRVNRFRCCCGPRRHIFGELLRRYDSLTFFHGNGLVSSDVCELVGFSAGPCDLC